MEKAIKDFVSKNGVNLLSDTEQLKTFLIEKSVDSEDIEKLIYFLDNGNLLDYIARIEKSNISSAELNNIIVGSYKATGLQITLIKKLTSIVLSAISIAHSLKPFEVILRTGGSKPIASVQYLALEGFFPYLAMYFAKLYAFSCVFCPFGVYS